MVRIVAISDTHNYHKSLVLPAGDILCHAGDSTSMGYQHEVEAFGSWLRSLTQYRHKIVIAGNHDRSFQDTYTKALEWLYGEPNYDHKDGLYYLEDNEITVQVDGQDVRIYGSPWQPFFCNWAFNLYEHDLKQKWDLIPSGLDVLITHGPPYKLLDKTSYGDEHVGSRSLREAIQRAAPKLAISGHIHEGYGVTKFSKSVIANAASCTVKYKPTNQPLVFDIDELGVVTQVI